MRKKKKEMRNRRGRERGNTLNEKGYVFIKERDMLNRKQILKPKPTNRVGTIGLH